MIMEINRLKEIIEKQNNDIEILQTEMKKLQHEIRVLNSM